MKSELCASGLHDQCGGDVAGGEIYPGDQYLCKCDCHNPAPPTEEPRTCRVCGAKLGHKLNCPIFAAGLREDRERAAKQDAYRDLDELRAAYERVVAERDAITQIANASEADRGRLRSDLNQATAVVEAAKAWRSCDLAWQGAGHDPDWVNALSSLAAAVDAYRAAPTGGVEG